MGYPRWSCHNRQISWLSFSSINDLLAELITANKLQYLKLQRLFHDFQLKLDM